MKNSFLSHYQKNLLVFVFSLVSSWLYSQAPTITAFTPTSGAVGSTVTITGTGFNTTAANNVVYIGGVKATVTSASATQLVVTVLAGGSGKVSATNLSTFLTAYSGKYFSITYANGGHDINSCAFPLNKTIATITPTVRIGTAWHDTRFNPTGTGDFNGDGKIDLVKVDGNTTVKGFDVYVNTSSGTGNFNFAVGIQVTSTRALSSLLVADFDNDGKLDVAATDGSTYEIYKNTTSSSSVTFAAPIVVSAGSSLRNMMGDINGDGKMDIVYSTNYGSVISLLLNTSSAGNLSFNGAVNYIGAMGGNRGLGVGDFNNDFKTDVVTGDEWNNGVNNGGTIQLSTSSATVATPTKVDVTSLIGCCFEGVVEAIDLNGDGKDDLIKRGSDALKISQNNWSSGVMTSADFSSVINKSLSGYTSNHLDMNGDGKIDLVGFNILGNGINSIKNNVGTTITAADLVNQTIDASVASPWGGFLGDFDLDGRNDVISLTPGSVNSTIQIYKNSPLPLITTTGTINAFVACAGSASTAQTVSVSGDYLTSAITLTAPTNFEISLASGSGYAASLALSPSSGSVSATTIYIRTKSTATGTLSGNLTLSATCATTQSISVSGTVNAVTSISAHPSTTAVSVCQNATLSALSVTAAGTSLTYQWYSNTTNSTSGATAITGATSTSYTPINSVASALYYYCVVTGTCGTVTSNISGLITVSVTPVAGTASATFSTICSGSTTTLSLTGNTGTIQWQSSSNNSTWTNISGATAASYTTPALSAITYYRAVVTSGSCTAVNSNVLTITIGTNQPFGNALALNGSGKIQFANQAQSAVGANFTVEAWVNVPSAASNIQTILSNSAGIGQAGGFRFGINRWNTSNGFLVFEGSTSFLESPVGITKNVWQHVAVVVNGSAISFFINGVLVGTSTGSFPPLSSTVLTLGSFSDNQYLFNGIMDEVRLWNVSKTQQDLLASMYTPLTGSESNLVAYFNFNQGTPGGTNTGITDLIDNGPNSLTGSLSEITRTGTAENFVANANPMAITGSLACVGSTVQLYHPQSGGTWSSAATGVASITSTGLVSCLTAGSSVISYVYTYNGCQFTNTYTMTVNATPVAPTVTTTSVSYCQNATATALVATAATSHTLRWYTLALGGTGSTTAITPVTSTAGTVTYYVSQANVSGCEGPRVAITVTVSPTSVAGTASVSASAICGGSTVDLSLTGNTGTVQWQSSPNNSTWTSITGATATNFTTSALNAITYFRAVVTSGGCTAVNSNVLTITVTTVAVPTTTINISECQGNTATQLSATALSGHTLQWYTLASGGTTLTTAPTPSTSSAGTTIYYVSQLNNTSNCESARVAITVTVYALPAAPTATTTINYCQGATATALAATATSGYSLQWYTGSTGGTASTTAPTPNTATVGSTTYYVSQKETAGSFVIDNPILDFYNNFISNFGQTFQVTSSVKLNSISIQSLYFSSSNSTTTLKIYNGFGGNLLATADAPFVNANPNWNTNNVSFSFSNQNVVLNSGVGYYFELVNTSTVYTRTSAPYTGGTGYANGSVISQDFAFKLESTLNVNPCESPRTAITVTINAVPTITGAQSMTVGGSTLQLTGSGTPNNTTPWASSNTAVATVSSTGVVTAVAGGNTTITYTNASGCSITAAVRVVDCAQPFGNALAFGQTTDFVQVNSSIFPSSTVTNFTIETWIRPSASDIVAGTPGGSWFGFLGSYNTLRNPSMWITNSGALHASWSENGSNFGTPVSASTPSSLVADRWTHIALVKDGTTMRIYANGIQVNSATCSASITIPNNFYWLGKVDNQFNGALDEVRFWSTAKTQTQLQNTMYTELVGNETGLLAYFDFNEGVAGGTNTSISTLTNKANNTSNGTLTNFTRTGTSSNIVGNTTSNIALTGAATFCANSTSQYTHPVAGGTWSVASGATATISATGLLTSTVNENITVSYAYTLNGCLFTATIAVAINSPAAPVTNATINLCQGSTTTALTATALTGHTLQWYTAATGGTASTTAPSPSTAALTTLNYFVSQKNNTTNCESSRSAITVTINAVPTITGEQNMAVGGSTLQLTGSGTPDATTPWASSNTAVASISSTGVVTAQGGGTTTITYTNTSGCSKTATIRVIDCAAPFGNALNFDGVNDYAVVDNVGNNSNFSFAGTSNFTLEAWVKRENTNGIAMIFSKYNAGVAGNYWLGIDSTGKPNLSREASPWGVTATNPMPVNEWHHIAATYDGSQTKIYVDGVVNNTTSAPLSINQNVSAIKVNIGAGLANNSPAYLFKGELDEIRVWNVARTATQIQQSFITTLQGNESGLVAYYDFNQGIAGGNNASVTTVVNTVNSASNGTLTNFTKTGTTSNFIGNTTTNISISGASNLCANATSQFTHIVAGGTWSVSSGAAATVSTSGLVTTMANEDITLSYTYAINGCSITVTKAISINTPAAPVATTSVNLCQGVTASALTATALAGHTLQWYTVASGGTASTTAPTPSTVNTGTITFYVSQKNNTTICESPRTAITVTINPSLAITAQPLATAQTYCINGTPIDLSVTATGSGTTYQWYSNSTASTTGANLITGATAATYTPDTTTATALYYYCVVTGTCGSATSGFSGKITVKALSVGGTATTTASSVCSGTTTTLSLTGHTGTIQWQQSADGTTGWSNVTGGSGATSATYTTSALTTATYFRALVTNSPCSVDYSDVVSVSLNAATALTVQPATTAQNVCINGITATIAVTATGSGITYQWYRNTSAINTGGTLISGATNSVFMPSNTLVGTTYYYCVVSSTCSLPITSSVSGAITIAPASVAGTINGTASVCLGSTTTLTLSGNVGTIQWQVLDSTVWTDIAGATSTTFTTPALTQNTTYRAVVTSGVCSAATTVIFNVVVNPLPVISGTTSVGAGESITLTATTTAASSNAWVSSTPAVASVSNTGVINGLITGTTTITFTNNNGCTDTETITVLAGITQTPVLTLPVTNTLGATTLNFNYSLPETPLAGSVTMTFTPTSGGTPIVWAMNNATSATFIYVVGTNPASISNVVSGVALGFTTYNVTLSYQDAFSNPASSVTNTNIQTLAPPSISFANANYNGVINQPISIQTVNSGGGMVTYSIAPTLPTGLTLNTATGLISGTPTVSLTQTSFTVTATNAAGADSELFNLFIDADTNGDGIGDVNDPDIDGDGILNGLDICPYTVNTSLVSQPNAQTVNLCLSAIPPALTVVAIGQQLTYQWYFNSSNSNTGGTAISGATSASYVPSTSTVTRFYYVVVSGTCGSAISNVSGAITISPTSVAGSIAGATTVCSGTNTTVLTLSGNTGTIQWQSSTDNITFTNIVSATTSTYTAINLTVTTYYRAVVTSGVCSSATTTASSVTVSPTSVAGNIAGATTVCSGTNATVLTLSGNTGTIQWQSSIDNVTFTNITGATTSTFTATNITATTYYRAVVTSGICSPATTSAITITVSPTSLPGSIAGATSVCSGTNSTVLTLSGNIGTIQWQWSTDNVTFFNIPSATTLTHTATNITTTTYYRAVITSGVCSSATTNVSMIAVNPTSVAGSITGATTVCSGTNSTVLTLSGNTGTIQWQSSIDNVTFTNIASATASTYTATNITATTYYRALVSSGVCSPATTTAVTITVNLTSVAGSIAGASTVCSGTNSTVLTLSGNTGTIQWQSSTNNVTFTNITGATASTYSATNLTATTYFRAVVTSGVCSSATTAAVTITVSPTSVAGSISGATTVCSGTNATVLTLSGNTGTIQWQSSIDNVTFTNITGATASTYTATNITATTYYRAVVSSGVCSPATTTSVTITVNPTSVAGSIAGATTVCSGTNSTLLTLSGNIGTIQWQSSTNNVTFTNITGATASTYTATNISATTYYRVVVTSGVCLSASSVAVTITYIPIVAPTAVSNQQYCYLNNPTVSSLVTTSGVGIKWYASATGGTPLTGSTPLTTATTYYASQTISVCESPIRVAVTVFLTCPVDAIADNFGLINGYAGATTASVLSNDTINGGILLPSQIILTGITVPTGLTLNANGSITIAPQTASGTYNITYRICEVLNPTNCDNVTFSIFVGACLDFAINDCDLDGESNGTEAANGTNPSDPCSYTNPPASSSTVYPTWSVLDCDGDGVINGQEITDGTSPTNPCSSNPINITVPLSASFLNGDCDSDGLLNGEEMGSNVNYPNDSNGNGIPDYLEVNNHTVSEDNLEVYSSLTPNGDGNNDVFIIRNIENYPENNVSIYNRWGIVVYDVDGYGQDNKYFKGVSEGRITINSQDELPIGTYFYIIKYKNNNGEQKQRSGYLYINR